MLGSVAPSRISVTRSADCFELECPALMKYVACHGADPTSKSWCLSVRTVVEAKPVLFELLGENGLQAWLRMLALIMMCECRRERVLQRNPRALGRSPIGSNDLNSVDAGP